MHIRKLYPVLVLLMAAVCPVFAQSQHTPSDKPNVFFGKEPKVDKSRLRDLKGVVKDDANQPVESAIVQLKDLKSGKVVEFVTKKDGAYLFYDTNMDIDYELTATRDGFSAPVKKKVTKYDSRKPAVLNFELERKKAA